MEKALPFGRAVTAGDGEGFMNHLILASGSPRRRELLSLYTTDFTVCVSDFDESAVYKTQYHKLHDILRKNTSDCRKQKQE